MLKEIIEIQKKNRVYIKSPAHWLEIATKNAREIEKLKYRMAREVLEEFLRKESWFMWDKKTMQNISNWINKQEKI